MIDNISKPKKDLTKSRFGKLVVTEFSHWSICGKQKISNWKCLCDCGNIKTFQAPSLKKGTRSCGCSTKELFIHRARSIKDSNQGAKIVYATYKHGAKRRNLEFKITLEEFIHLSQQNCYLCGEVPKQIREVFTLSVIVKPFVFNGIDRFDNSEGYTLDNSKPCCKDCNYMKLNTDIKTFVNKMRRIINNIDSNSELLDLVSEEYVKYGNG